LNPQAQVAFSRWLEKAGETVSALPSLQRDRISYVRCSVIDH